MGSLTEHLRNLLLKEARLGSALQSKEDFTQNLRGEFARIFQTKDFPLNSEATTLFSQVAQDLKIHLENFKPIVGKQMLSRADRIITNSLKSLTEDTQWQTLLLEITDVKKRKEFERDIRSAFIFKIISILLSQNPHLKTQAEFIRIAANTKDQLSEKERLQKLEDKIPTAISPTVCYFSGKGDLLKKDFTHFGHTAVGIGIEHDLIFSNSPPPLPPLQTKEAMEAYVDSLPLDPDHNAYIVAEDHFNLPLLSTDNKADLEGHTLRAISDFNRNSPVLIKMRDDFLIYGCMNGKWGTTSLTGLTKEELLALKQLSFEGSKLRIGDPKLAALSDLVKRGHTPETRVYYLDRTKEQLISSLVRTSKDLEEFKNHYLKAEFPNDERPLSLLKNLSFVDLHHLASTLKHEPTEFSSYLTYGDSRTSRKTGVGTNSDFLSEKQIYGNHYTLITLPSCDKASFNKAKEEFAERDRNNYKLLFQNCAHAVSQFMKTAGHLPKEEYIIDPTPRACAVRAFQLVLNELRQDRKRILSSTELSGSEKICLLLKNDLRRLELQIQLNNINHLSSIKNQQKTLAKMAGLQTLIHAFSPPHEISSKQFDLLVQFQESLGNKTARNLEECIACFPEEKLSAVAIERKRQVQTAFEEPKLLKKLDSVSDPKNSQNKDAIIEYAVQLAEAINNGKVLQNRETIRSLIKDELFEEEASLTLPRLQKLKCVLDAYKSYDASTKHEAVCSSIELFKQEMEVMLNEQEDGELKHMITLAKKAIKSYPYTAVDQHEREFSLPSLGEYVSDQAEQEKRRSAINNYEQWQNAVIKAKNIITSTKKFLSIHNLTDFNQAYAEYAKSLDEVKNASASNAAKTMSGMDSIKAACEWNCLINQRKLIEELDTWLAFQSKHVPNVELKKNKLFKDLLGFKEKILESYAFNIEQFIETYHRIPKATAGHKSSLAGAHAFFQTPDASSGEESLYQNKKQSPILNSASTSSNSDGDSDQTENNSHDQLPDRQPRT